jgi:excisionase family DNA binding protein
VLGGQWDARIVFALQQLRADHESATLREGSNANPSAVLRSQQDGLSSRSQMFSTVRFPSENRTGSSSAVPIHHRVSQGVCPPGVPTSFPLHNGRHRLSRGADDLLSVAEVARRLGMSTFTIYALCERSELPHVRVSNAIRIAPTDLAAFIARARRPGHSEEP